MRYSPSKEYLGLRVLERTYGDHRQYGTIIDFIEGKYGGVFNVVLLDDGNKVHVPNFTTRGIGYHLQFH